MTEIAVYAPSSNPVLGNRLLDFETDSERAARQNLETALATAGSSADAYTGPEIRAMIKLEQLKLIGDLGFAEVLLRGKIINEIEREGLWSVHPEGYGSMQDAAKAQGISVSEYSDIRQLYNTIFPYITEHIETPLAILWEEIGKSNFRELIPFLARAITDERNQSQRVENVYEQMLNDIHATDPELTEEEGRHLVIEQLLEAGHLPNRQMRERIRPERTPSIPALAIDYEEAGQTKVVIAHISNDQYDMLMRKMGGYIEVMPFTMDRLARSNFIRIVNQSVER